MVIADNEGVTLVLGEAGQGQVARVRIEKAPIPMRGSVLLVFVVGLEGPLRINLSRREAADLAQMLNAFAR